MMQKKCRMHTAVEEGKYEKEFVSNMLLLGSNLKDTIKHNSLAIKRGSLSICSTFYQSIS